MTEERCPTCGATCKAYFSTLTPGLVAVLIQCIQWVHQHDRNEFHLQNDLHLSFKENSNFSKLRQHALVAKIDGKPGKWLITNRGGAFLRGEIAVPLKVQTYRNEVIGHSTELIHIRELRGKVPEFEQRFAYEVMPPAERSKSIQPALLS